MHKAVKRWRLAFLKWHLGHRQLTRRNRIRSVVRLKFMTRGSFHAELDRLANRVIEILPHWPFSRWLVQKPGLASIELFLRSIDEQIAEHIGLFYWDWCFRTMVVVVLLWLVAFNDRILLTALCHNFPRRGMTKELSRDRFLIGHHVSGRLDVMAFLDWEKSHRVLIFTEDLLFLYGELKAILSADWGLRILKVHIDNFRGFIVREAVTSVGSGVENFVSEFSFEYWLRLQKLK